MTIQEQAARGADVEDLLEHIAWQETILPSLVKSRDILSKQLVQATLEPTAATQLGSREMIAGKIYGIDFVVKEIERLVRAGQQAQHSLAMQ